jgi:hypothetical protein
MTLGEELDSLEGELKVEVERQALSGSRKTPDSPLGEVVEEKLARRRRLKMTGTQDE